MHPGKNFWIRNRESSHAFRTENLLRYLLAISPQASSIRKPISWSDMYAFMAEVQLSDIKPAKVDLKNRMCVERWSPCPRSVVTCHYLLSACSDIPGLSEYYHCTKNCTTSHDMAEHPHRSSHGHHSQLGQGSLVFQAWICWANGCSTRPAEAWTLILTDETNTTWRSFPCLSNLFWICYTHLTYTSLLIHTTRKPQYNSLIKMTATLMPTVKMYQTHSQLEKDK